MIAVSAIDTVGGLIIAIASGVWLIIDGLRDRAHLRTAGAVGLPTSPRVEADEIVAADATCREGVAGRSSRLPSAATSIADLTCPHPYSRIGNRR